MRILAVGTGGVGSAFAGIARRRSFFEHCALADYETSRPESVVASLDDGRFSAHRLDASSRDDVLRLVRETRADAVLDAVDPVFDMPIFDACFEARVTYLDMAMSLSAPHPDRPSAYTARRARERSSPVSERTARRTYLYHVVDNEWSMREYGSQAVVWQTAINPAIALELLASGGWAGAGVLGPEAFPAAPFLAKLAECGSPHRVLELDPTS